MANGLPTSDLRAQILAVLNDRSDDAEQLRRIRAIVAAEPSAFTAAIKEERQRQMHAGVRRPTSVKPIGSKPAISKPQSALTTSQILEQFEPRPLAEYPSTHEGFLRAGRYGRR